MNIIKFGNFINESVVNDSAEDIIRQVLMRIKRKVEKMFASSEDNEEVIRYGENVDKVRRDKGGMSLVDLGPN
jgi:hypothetical protein